MNHGANVVVTDGIAATSSVACDDNISTMKTLASDRCLIDIDPSVFVIW